MNTGLTQKEFDWIKRIEAEVDKVWDDLNDWEKRFMENILEMFRRYGMKTKLSKGQWRVLDRISEKII
jgi:hypothetical protein